MSYEITDVRRSGYFEAYFNGEKINRPNHSGNHTNENEAEQTIFWHAGTQPEGDYEYEIRPARTIINVRVVGSVAGQVDPPGIPQNFTATVVDHQQVNLSWSAVTDATGYQIYQDAAPLDTTSGTTYSVIGLSPATQYDFNVAAYNSGGSSNLSSTETVTTDTNSPPVWSLGNQSGETDDVFSILLDDFCTDPDGDTITYSHVSGTLPAGLALSGARNETLSGTLSEVDVDVFTLGADDGVNTRVDVQITFTVTTPDTIAPDPPAAPTVESFTSAAIVLNLPTSAAPDHASYEVHRSLDGVAFGLRQANVTAAQWADTGLSSDTTYWYALKDVDTSGNISALGPSVSQQTAAAPDPTALYLLDDFTTVRDMPYGDPPPTPLWVWAGANPNQTSALEMHEGSMRLRVTATATGTTGPGSDKSIQVQCAPNQGTPRYPFPAGYIRTYIKNKVWDDPLINVMGMWVKSDRADGFNERENVILGTYIKAHNNPDGNWQGAHYYNFISTKFTPNVWIKMHFTWHPGYQVGSDPSISWGSDPEYGQNGNNGHYFDSMTRCYIDHKGSYTYPMTFHVDDVTLWRDDLINTDTIMSVAMHYDGSRYYVGFNHVRGPAQVITYEFRYSTQSMKENGFYSGTDGGTVNSRGPGTGYTGREWTSPVMAQDPAGMYVAIKPTTSPDNNFHEIYYPNIANNPPWI